MTKSVLNHPFISERYFFPRRAALPDPFWVTGAEDGIQLACHYHRPHPGAKTLVHFHGNGEIVLDYLDEFVNAIAALGFNCLLAEYRGYGASTGHPQLVAMLDDVAHIIASTGEPLAQMVLFGRSVGSIYALHGAGQRPDVAGLIIESGIADPLDRVLLRVEPSTLGVTLETMQAEVNTHLNHRAKLAAYQGATLIMHTRYDGLIELNHAERLHDWASEPKHLKIFEQGNHNSIMMVNATAYFETVKAFVESLP